MAQNSQTPAKKGNKTTEVIIGQGAQKFLGAVKQLESVVQVIGKLPDTIQESVLQVTNLEDKIGGLKQELVNQTAQNKIEIQQAYEADRDAFANKWLQDNNVVAVNQEELAGLKQKVANFDQTLENTVKTEVGKAVGIEKANSANALKVQQLEHEKKEAENVAKIAQLQQQNTFLAQQMEYWKKALDDERQAGIERAKASSIHTLNVGGTTQGR